MVYDNDTRHIRNVPGNARYIHNDTVETTHNTRNVLRALGRMMPQSINQREVSTMTHDYDYTCEAGVIFTDTTCEDGATFKILTTAGDVYACDKHLATVIRVAQPTGWHELYEVRRMFPVR